MRNLNSMNAPKRQFRGAKAALFSKQRNEMLQQIILIYRANQYDLLFKSI